MNSCYRRNPAPPPSSCAECGILSECGGWDDERRHRGCFQRCEGCFDTECDYTCLANPILFGRSVEEVGGMGKIPTRLASLDSGAAPLPWYLPQIDHGGQRARVLKEQVVSIPLYRLCRFNRYGRLELLHQSRSVLLNAFKLSERTAILVTSVCKDRWIEGLYESRKLLLPLLKELGLFAMTAPNFSFVRDTPRSNSIWNQTKMFRVMEDMTDAGIAVIPHLQAQTKKDWARLQEVYAEFPSVRHACMEFQTGLNREDPNFPAREVYKGHFRDFQQATGGRVHPIVLAGYREIGFLGETCQSYSMVDACAFVKTVNYQEARIDFDGKLRWRQAGLAMQNNMAALLEQNISKQREYLLRKNGLGINGRSLTPSLLPAA